MQNTMTDLPEIWTYLTRGPLLWLTATLAAYAIGDACFRAANRAPVVNPVLIAVALLAGLLYATGTAYPTYFEGAQFVHFLLGPATVCLASPLWDNLPRVRRAALPLLAALLAGSVTAITTALWIAHLLGITGETLASLAPKSATAPVAIGISQAIGGSPTLTAVLVILTGITGAVVATPLLNLIGIKDWRARGFAVGVAAHGIGTARAFQVNPTAGAFAGLGMGLNAVLTALIAPLVLGLFH
jgi:predicted murein hydrolase (TIGR00659 family)